MRLSGADGGERERDRRKAGTFSRRGGRSDSGGPRVLPAGRHRGSKSSAGGCDRETEHEQFAAVYGPRETIPAPGPAPPVGPGAPAPVGRRLGTPPA